MKQAVIVSAARTGLAKSFRGSFNTTHGATMGGHAVRAAVERAGIDPASIEDCVIGCGYPEGATGQNIARQIAIRAGLPVSVAGFTVNRFCSSGLQSVALAANAITAEGAGPMVAGGLESISLVQPEAKRVTEDWIVERTGIRQRHVAAAHEHTSDLAYEAGRRALDDAGLDAADLDLVQVTPTGDDDVLTTDAVSFSGLVAGGSATFHAQIDPSLHSAGTYSASYGFDVADENLPGSTLGSGLTLTLTGTVSAANFPFDDDGDADVDDLDAANYIDCMSGPDGGWIQLLCANHDADADGDVDLKDAAQLQLEFSGTLP